MCGGEQGADAAGAGEGKEDPVSGAQDTVTHTGNNREQLVQEKDRRIQYLELRIQQLKQVN